MDDEEGGCGGAVIVGLLVLVISGRPSTGGIGGRSNFFNNAFNVASLLPKGLRLTLTLLVLKLSDMIGLLRLAVVVLLIVRGRGGSCLLTIFSAK